MHRPPTLFIVVMLTLLGVTAACVVAAFWVPQTVLIAIGTGVVFIGLAAWMIFTMPRGRSAGAMLELEDHELRSAPSPEAPCR